MEDIKTHYSQEKDQALNMNADPQNAAIEGELARGLYVSTEIENGPTRPCGLICGSREQRLTHTIHAFTRPIPITAGQVKLNSADELIGKPIIKQRLNEKYVNRNLNNSPTNKFLSFGVASMRNLNSTAQISYRSSSTTSIPTNRSYTYLSSVNKSVTSNSNIPFSSRETVSSLQPFFKNFASMFNGICSCPGFISICKNNKIQTIEQETIPSDSDFAESDSENDDVGLDVAQEEQN